MLDSVALRSASVSRSVVYASNPALDCAHTDAKSLSNMPLAPSAVGHEDSLATGMQSAAESGVHGLSQQQPFGFIQRESDHHASLPASVTGRIAEATGQGYPEFV
jgi:hypothetical protein